MSRGRGYCHADSFVERLMEGESGGERRETGPFR